MQTVVTVDKYRRRAAIGILAGALIALTMIATPLDRASATAGAEAFVKKVAGNVVSTIKSGGSDAQQLSRFRSVFTSNADIPSIGTFALGKYAKQLPSSRRSEYFSLVEKFVTKVFLSRMTRAAVNTVEVKGSQTFGKDEVVTTNVAFTDGRPDLVFKWRVRRKGGGYKVVDISVAGVWLAVEQRSTFVSVINQAGGDVGALLSYLRQQVA
jgi:phospholipid transport system substrate-binding protein